MKRLLLGLCGVLLLSAIGPVPRASAWWLWHRHHKNAAKPSASASDPAAGTASTSAPAPAPSHMQKHSRWWHHQHHDKAATATAQNGVVTTPGPRSMGWWHKHPGPAGAGAE